MADRDYLVTARKYRPSLFKELVAQEHVADTLKNAIKLDRLAHAYLFSGPRGVGKTTSARILAKAINCEMPREEREDGAEPCCECDSCTSFEEGRSLNVFEMDAASNNKVDDVRELREKVRIPPQGDQKKVYILDEVHMLSKQAFNALLKTLEEPPPHALFIFATTEPHKVLPTILSRCQRFDFRRIPVPDIVDRLREVCHEEGIEADEESLMLLARKGDGALRDALSAFDQAISLCGSTLEYSELAQAMGVVDQDLYFDLTEHVATQDTAGVLELVRHVVRSGYDLQEFLVGLAEHLRNLLVAHSLGGEALEGVAESTRRQYGKEAERFGEADLLRLLTAAGEAEDDVKNSPQPRLKLETTLLKMAQMRRAADLREVIQKIDRLEQLAESGELPESIPDGSAGDVSDAASDEGTASSDEPQAAAETAAEPASSYEPPTEESPAEDDSKAQTDRSEPATETNDAAPSPSSSDSAEAAPEESASGSDEPERTPSSPEESAAEDPGSSSATDDDAGMDESDDESSVGYDDLFGSPALDKSASGGDGASGDGPTDAQGGSSASSGGAGAGPQAAVAEPTVEASGTSVDGLVQEWPQFVDAVKEERIRLGSLLGEAEPVEIMGTELTVAVPKSFHRDSLRDEHNFLLERLTDTFDVAVEELRFVVETSSPDPETTNESGDPMSPREQLQELRDTYSALDVLFEEFGAEPVW